MLFLKRFLKHKLATVGLGIIFFVFVIGIFGKFIAPFDPLSQDFTSLMIPPFTNHHYLGTDQLGRDILSRILCGTFYTLLIGVAITVVDLVIGGLLGMVAGFYGGYWDAIITRIVDITLSIPTIIFALVIASIGKPGLIGVIIAISAVGWRGFTRIVRGETLKIRNQEYIEAARASGASNFRILLKHVLPNLLPITMVYASLYIARAILTAAALSFLGLGIQPPTPEWGLLISSGRSYLDEAWWIATFPGLALMFTILGFNFLGDGLRDTLDPRLKGVI